MSQEAPINIGLFKIENIAKAGFFLIGLIIQGMVIFQNVKQEIHDNKTLDYADKQVINFRLQNLESHFSQAAILPKECKIESK